MAEEQTREPQDGWEQAPAAPLVSVIVPVCNVERYVGACLDGLHAQTLEDIEILLVDDGSRDGSPAILAEHASRDPRMRVITKPNGGYGSGVNRGLAEARGEYIGIVEPDDLVDKHMYEELYAAAQLADGTRADVVKSSYWEFYDLPGEPSYLKRPNLMNCMPHQGFTGTVQQNCEVLFHHPSIWSAIYRRGFLEEHGIRMMEAPGGGWVDNPFFFETLLQAKTFVWLPSAFYYYRQTNPDSSSNLKDYHLPFDRLRDLRALFERLGVEDPQIIACLYARHFFYISSVIGEWGYSEQDEELGALIREAMEALDPTVLYGDVRGIRPEHLAFYESVVGDPARRIKRRGASLTPAVSVVVPMCNDRNVLGHTLESIAAQTLGDIEVICADGGSVDASCRIAAAFAAKDARFCVVEAEGAGYAAALHAGIARATAPATVVVRPQIALPKDHLARALAALDHGADLAVTVASRTPGYVPLAAGEDEAVLSVSGLEAELLLCVDDEPAGCIFKTGLLRSHPVAADEDGRLLLLQAVLAAKTAAVRIGAVPQPAQVREAFTRPSGRSEADVARLHEEQLQAGFELARGAGAGALRAFRCLAVRVLYQDAMSFLAADGAEGIFERLGSLFWNEFGLQDTPRGSYCNQNTLQALELMFSAPYDVSLRREALRLQRANEVLAERAAELKQSTSYRLGNVVARAGHAVFSEQMIKRLKGWGGPSARR